jgi:hypothetical protein
MEQRAKPYFLNSQTLGLYDIVKQVDQKTIDVLGLQQTDKDLIKYDKSLIC